MSQDLLQILTGETQAPKAPKAAKPAKAYEPFDAAVRTIIAEESDPVAQEWVAGVIANRAKKAGKNFYEVVTEENQFEPWARGTAQKVDPNSDAYRTAAARVKDILEGKRDPTEGATHFYAPKAQAELGREKPEWDDGTGVQVGNTLFFRDPGQRNELVSVIGAEPSQEALAAAEAEYAKMFGDPSKYEDTAELTAGTVPFREIKGQKVKGVLSKDQEGLYEALNKGGGYKPDDPDGSAYNPFFMQEGVSEKDIPPGSYYVTRKGDFKRAGGGEKVESDIGRGFGQGLSDVYLSLAQALPGLENSTIANRLATDQMVYDADLKGDLTSGLARFTGQAIPTTVALAGGEALLAPKMAQSAIGRFLIGKGGTEMAPGAGRAATRLASRMSRGAAEGAGASAMVSSASDAPIEEQLGAGALAGGVLGGAAPVADGLGRWAGRSTRNLMEPWTESGREKAITRLLGEVAPEGASPDLRELVPGSVPTLGEASGSAGLATLERNVRTNPKVADRFAERLDQNALARKDYLESIAKDPEAIVEAEAARDAATAPLRQKAFEGAGAADPTNAIAKIDEILAGPSGQRDAVVKALKIIRGKLAQDLDIGGGKTVVQPQTDVEQLYGVRKALDDMLSPLAPSELKGAQLATRELMEVKAAIDKAIEGAAPGFKDYLKTYSDMSKPIDEMKLLQSMNLTDAKGNLTLAKVQKAIDKIETQRKAGGTNKAKSVSTDTLDALKNLRDDLKRAADIDKGKARGSDTSQNLVTGRIAEDMDIPVSLGVGATAGPGAAFLLGLGKRAFGAKNDQMLQQLATRLLQPEMAVPNVTLKPRPNALPLGEVALPALGGLGASAILGQK